MKVIYYWYHHGLAWCDEDSGEYEDFLAIQQALTEKDYELFMELKGMYNDCLPNEAVVFDGDVIVEQIDITIPENFMKITYNEYECG